MAQNQTFLGKRNFDLLEWFFKHFVLTWKKFGMASGGWMEYTNWSGPYHRIFWFSLFAFGSNGLFTGLWYQDSTGCSKPFSGALKLLAYSRGLGAGGVMGF